MKRLLPVLMGFVVLLGIQQAQAYDPIHLKSLKETNQCRDCDLQGALLPGANLERTNLQRTNLRGADLRDANLQDADLRRANLRYAKLDSEGVKIARASGAINVPEPEGTRTRRQNKNVEKLKPKPPTATRNFCSAESAMG